MNKKIRVLAFLVIISFHVTAQETPALSLTKKATFHAGLQPKQVIFSPDGRYMVLPLLDDKGFRVISTENPDDSRIIAPPNAEKLGFAEGVFVPEKKAFFVSQMTTGKIYEYEYPGFSYRREIKTGGDWSKFITYSSEKNLLAVSNWISNDVSLIDYETGNLLRLVKTGAAPRGLSFIDKGESLIVACYDGGQIQKIKTADGEKLAEKKVEKSAMRHIVLSGDEKTAYISDMFHFAVYAFDLSEFKITRTWKVYNNPNTICLLNDRYLFVSSRGPNNKTDYTLRSPENGKITVFDVVTGNEILKITGGNQPTGLDISKDGKFLAITNFQDANVDVYDIVLNPE